MSNVTLVILLHGDKTFDNLFVIHDDKFNFLEIVLIIETPYKLPDFQKPLNSGNNKPTLHNFLKPRRQILLLKLLHPIDPMDFESHFIFEEHFLLILF